MSDKEDNNIGGFQLSRDGVNCLCCKFRKNTYHKETKTTTENNKVVVNVVEDRSSFKIGNRGTTPDDHIFKPDTTYQLGSIEDCTTGWSVGRKPTPEENQERIFKLETDVEAMRKDIAELKIHELSGMD